VKVTGGGKGDKAEEPWAIAVLVLAAAAALVPSAVSTLVAPEREGGAEVERILRAALLLAFVVLIAMRLYDSLRSRSRPAIRNGGLVLALLAYWLVGMLSLLWNSRSLPQLSAIAIPLVILAVAMYGGGPRLALRVLEYCVVAVCYASLVLAVAYPSAAFPIGPTFEPARLLGFLTDQRLAGIVRHPNVLALLAAVAILLVATRRGRFWPLHLAAATLVVVLTESRTTAGALVGALGVLVLALKITDDESQARFFRAVAVLIWSFVVLLPLLAAAGLLSLTFNGRTAIWDYALSHVDERPLLGFGPGVWADFTAAGDIRIGSHGHNQFVESIVTLGALGVAVIVLIALLWLRSVSPHRTSGFKAALTAFSLIWLVAIFESPVSLWGVNPLSWLLVMLTVASLGLESSPSPSDVGSLDGTRPQDRPALSGDTPT
jgi:O-antigen ligase